MNRRRSIPPSNSITSFSRSATALQPSAGREAAGGPGRAAMGCARASVVLGTLMLVLASAGLVGPGPAGAAARAATGTCQAVGGGAGPAGGPHRATVVVDTGSGPVWSACVSFSGTISGLVAVDAARAQIPGLDPVYDPYPGNGRAVCKLRGTGNDPPDCLSKSAAYWAYFRNGAYSRAGAGSSTVSDGDTEGWRWGTSSAGPRAATNGYRAAAAPPPTTRPPVTQPPPPATTRPPATRAPASTPPAAPRPSNSGSAAGATQGPGTAGTRPSVAPSDGATAADPGTGTRGQSAGSSTGTSRSATGTGDRATKSGTKPGTKAGAKPDARSSSTEETAGSAGRTGTTARADRTTRPGGSSAKAGRGTASDQEAAGSPTRRGDGGGDSSTGGGSGAGSAIGFAVALVALSGAGWFLHRRRVASPAP